MVQHLSRREFLVKTTQATGAMALAGAGVEALPSPPRAGGLPRRRLGRTGVEVAVIGMGLAPLGMALGGAVFDWTGKDISVMYISCGIVLTVLLSVLTANRQLRDYLGTEFVVQTSPVTEAS